MIEKLTKPGKLCYFMFKNVGDGCLFSKYGNSDVPSPVIECAKLLMREAEPPMDLFAGTYICTWVENARLQETEQAILVIEKKKGVDGIYILQWREKIDPSSDVSFEGEGMLYEDLLIGAYH